MIDKKEIVIRNYFKTDCDLNTSIKQAYKKGFNRAYEKCMREIMNLRTELNSVKSQLQLNKIKLTECSELANCCASISYPNGFNPQSNCCASISYPDGFNPQSNWCGN